MKPNYFGILKANKKVVINVAIILFAFFLFMRSFFIETDQKRFEGGLKNIQEEQYQGSVIDKKFEKFNHNASMIYLNNRTKVSIFGEFWSKIKIGDSLEKKRGETIITVYRNNEKFTLDNKEILDKFKK